MTRSRVGGGLGGGGRVGAVVIDEGRAGVPSLQRLQRRGQRWIDDRAGEALRGPGSFTAMPPIGNTCEEPPPDSTPTSECEPMTTTFLAVLAIGQQAAVVLQQDDGFFRVGLG